MKIAIIGSRTLHVDNLEKIIPKECTEVVSGGAVGVDTSAEEFARRQGLPIKRFLPEYDKYGRGAPLVRNKLIVEYADAVYAFWDGKSRGTIHTVKYAREIGKPVRIFTLKRNENG